MNIGPVRWDKVFDVTRSARTNSGVYAPTSCQRPVLSYVARLSIVAMIVITCGGCIGTLTNLRPIKSEPPIILFDRYHVKMGGGGDSLYSLDCEVNFTSKVSDTTDIDSIPIFLVDSLCFEGECVDSTYCLAPDRWSEPDMSLYSKEIDTLYIHPAPDLWRVDHKIELRRFTFWRALNLRCQNRPVWIDIHAVLVDRRTGNEMGRQSRRVQFAIKKSHYLIGGV